MWYNNRSLLTTTAYIIYTEDCDSKEIKILAYNYLFPGIDIVHSVYNAANTYDISYDLN